MKVLGSLMMIGATTLLGCRAAMDMETSYSQLKYIRQLMYMLQSEIRYSQSYLAEAFLHISEQVKDPYAAWLRQLYYRMIHRRSGNFEKLWSDTIREYLNGLKVPATEMKRLEQVGQYLGSADTQMQVKNIELFIEQIDIEMREMREGLGNRKRLCHCLGVMSGIFLAILLI